MGNVLMECTNQTKMESLLKGCDFFKYVDATKNQNFVPHFPQNNEKLNFGKIF
jgi:hypothetical protein